MVHGCEDGCSREGCGSKYCLLFFLLLREGRILVVSLKCNYIMSLCMQSHTPTLIEHPPHVPIHVNDQTQECCFDLFFPDIFNEFKECES